MSLTMDIEIQNNEIDVPNQVQKLIVALEANFANRNLELGRDSSIDIGYNVLPGNKYLKIVYGYKTSVPGELEQQSVHAFVDKKNGDLYKASSWKTPAKGARFNLYSDIDALTKLADCHGGYLYKGSNCSLVANAMKTNNTNTEKGTTDAI